jgi:FG-GAP-like repeat
MLRLLCALVLIAASAARAEAWKIEAVETPGAVRELIEVGGEPRIATALGWFRAVADGARIRLEGAPPPRFPPIPVDALQDGRIAAGKREIARAWLAEPTNRYGHGVLGDAIEAASIVVERKDGKRETVRLGHDSVFEDLEPRIADLGSGEKIVVVKSYLVAGSALAVIGERDGRFAVLAETPPIGTPNRWLNPAGIADFDGDGAVEIAFVRMPHALGRLELWRWSAGKLLKVTETRDTSNHAIGSRALGQSAVADFDGDGVADLAIPSFDRRAVRLLSFRGGVREIARIKLPASVTTNFIALASQGLSEILFGTADGKLFRLHR